MKISNETKIGIMAVVGVAMLVIGFKYLKGSGIFKKENHIYAVYADVQGLKQSNPVVINGMQVGRIENLDGGKDMKRILVTVSLTKDVNIPTNSLAVINPNLLGSPTMEIQLGDANTYLKNGDTLLTTLSSGAFDEAMKIINPVLYEVKNAVKSLDSVLTTVTTVFDVRAKDNIQSILANVNAATASFAVTSQSLQKLVDVQKGALGQSLENMKTFTSNLNTNNNHLDSIMKNAAVFSDKLSKIDLKQTLDTLQVAINNFKAGAEKINSKEGSLGLLLNDKTLYHNLESTTDKLNILLDDIRVHPKRYVNFSVFGKKDKGDYLKAPLIDDTLKAAKK
ncbi:MAG TPA: MlaD family protein [Hanamia sp.]|nr:MlaD family protein [Hanamia sp.]